MDSSDDSDFRWPDSSQATSLQGNSKVFKYSRVNQSTVRRVTFPARAVRVTGRGWWVPGAPVPAGLYQISIRAEPRPTHSHSIIIAPEEAGGHGSLLVCRCENKFVSRLFCTKTTVCLSAAALGVMSIIPANLANYTTTISAGERFSRRDLQSWSMPCAAGEHDSIGSHDVSKESNLCTLYPYPLVLTAMFHNDWTMGDLHCQASGFIMGPT
ncbi:hypothetical protein CCH79_00005907 [Gambusia affinis]|uniref:Uncharacterized protein n=1 Tax=Gambusia affinis TaxID=33528 RepID=A0A315VVI0_GAMAF|nr:hypothetical protein CCH79_00005907 [Gambusia affinis]